ncbi:MAG TPA: glycosyltransferase family 4 protein [Thermoguttaceae bacterium]|nr:glycosyltransferase family 4 protein [Thermoguttaceae bacterium]
MKILYHHRTLGDGAEGIHIAEMINAFRNLGHSVSTVCPKGASSLQGMASRNGDTANAIVTMKRYVPRFVAQVAEMSYNAVSYAAVRRAIRRYTPDFVYERYSFFGIGGLLAARSENVPTILEVNATLAGRLATCHRLYFNPLAEWIETYVFRRSAGIAVVSQALRDRLTELGVPPNRVIVTANAINPESVRFGEFDQARHAVRTQFGLSGRTVVGFVGSLRVIHGIGLLMEAIPEICARHPQSHFLIVGTGETEGRFRRFVRDQNLEDRVTFTGGLPHRDVFRHISAMDIAVMPDSNAHGSPMKLLEYMGMGKPTIAPRLGPVEELIDDDVTGRLVEAGNKEAFVDAVIDLAEYPRRREAIGEAARRKVLATRTWERNADLVLELYQLRERARTRGSSP